MNHLLSKTSISSVLRRWLIGLAVFIFVVFLIIHFFPWDALRGPINRYVSEQLGRRFEITRHLSVKVGWTTTVKADGVEIVNPEWAHDSYLLKADSAEFDINLLPLLIGKVVLPKIALSEPTIGLQIEPDGRRTWALSRNTSDKGSVPEIGSLLVDKGTLNYLAREQGADLSVQFSLENEAKEPTSKLPLVYKASGQWNHQQFKASGRTGGVLQLSKDTQASFPLEVDATAGKTHLQAKGSIANLAEFQGIKAAFDLQGQNLDDLYKLLGVVLPSTPPYKVGGQIDKQGKLWTISKMQGLLGRSDIDGTLSFDQSQTVPFLKGQVQSKVMDFADLAPVVGLAPLGTSSSKRRATVTSAQKRASVSVSSSASTRAASTTRGNKVLPITPLDVSKIKAMNADVTYSAASIRHVKELPLDKGSVHVKLHNGVLKLEPISLGVAGGTMAGTIVVDANLAPAAFTTRLDVRGLQFNQLFPTVKTTQTGFGKVSGKFDLKGRGNSVAQMLGSASGHMSVLMGKGEISNLLLEFMGLDGGEVIKFFLRGDRNVPLRCAAVDFEIKHGLMSSRAIVLDTTDTVITGEGQVSLAHETLDILLKPEPKDKSILSFRTPLRIGGTFAFPSAGPEKAALAGRIGLAVALAAINPLLALAATIETGPGENADCASILKQASNSAPASKPSTKTK